MQQSAPVDEPGYAKAHFWLAKYYLRIENRVVGGAEAKPFLGSYACGAQPDPRIGF